MKGYAWDGASGPTVDSKTALPPSAVHDAGYQLMRLGLLPPEAKSALDNIFYRMLRDRGMGRFRAGYWWQGVAWLGWAATLPKNRNTVLEAP